MKTVIKQTSAILLTAGLLLPQISLALEPGLLPTNPFYFLKGITRSAYMLFSPGVVRKAETALSIFNDKAEEFKKLASLDVAPATGLSRALTSVEEGVEGLAARLSALSDKQDDLERLDRRIIEETVRHVVELHRLTVPTTETSVVRVAEHVFMGVLRDSADRFSDETLRDELFRGALNAVDADALERLYFITLYRDTRATFASDLTELHEDAFVSFSGEILALGLTKEIRDALISSDPHFSLLLIDRLRDVLALSSVKEELGLLRQSLLSRIDEESAIVPPIQTRLRRLESSLLEENRGASFGRSAYYLEQAQSLLDQGANALAFAQVIAGELAFEDALSSFTVSSELVSSLRSTYDELLLRSQSGDISTTSPAMAISGLLGRAEKDIVSFSPRGTSRADEVARYRDVLIYLKASEILLEE